MGWRAPLERLIAATVLALAGATLAVFVWPQMRRSDLLLRNGVRAEAAVVALDRATCVHTNSRVNREYPCFRATGEWTHAGVAYRATLGHYTQPNEAPLGTTVPIVVHPIRRLRPARSICSSASSAPGRLFLVRSGPSMWDCWRWPGCCVLRY